MRSLYYSISLFLLTFSGVGAVGPTIDLGYATYRGTELGNGVNQWLGVRYAAAPLGDLRFRDPQGPVSVDDVQAANVSMPVCLSTGDTTLKDSTSEDCLFLDVFAPTNATSTSGLPVYVFIQGGGFNSNANAKLNGTGLVEASDMDMVVVTFNYRVGPYGFLASQEVIADGNLNVGLKDQRKVFQWVQKHISQFGGDPGHVTIGGASAGAGSVDLHLTAYGGRDDGLFHAAAAESQSFATQLTVEQSQYQYDALVERAGCQAANDTLKCLRDLSVAELQAVNTQIPFPNGTMTPLFMYSNVVDYDFTPDFTYNLFAQGKFVHVPVIFGDDTNEGTIFAPRSTSSYDDMNAFLKAQFPFVTDDQLTKIDAFYPRIPGDYPNTGPFFLTLAQAYGEMRYICPGIYISSAFANLSEYPSWNYRYDVHDPGMDADGSGVTHTIEVSAIWGPNNTNGNAPQSYYEGGINADAVRVTQGYWTSFIRSYDPNKYRAEGAPVWEAFGQDQARRIVIRTNDTAMEDVPEEQRERCAYLNEIGPELQQFFSTEIPPPSFHAS